MNEEISITLSVTESPNEIEDLIEQLNDFEEIENARPVETMGIGTSILIAILPALITGLLTKAPGAIYKIVKFIKKILEKSKESTKQPTIIINIGGTIVQNFNSTSEKDIETKIQEMLESKGD